MSFDLRGKTIWVAGHRGMVGSAVVRQLAHADCTVLTESRSEVDLRNQAQVDQWMSRNRPDAVILAAAKVGGIVANQTYAADFLYDNLMIQANVVEAAFRNGVQKLVVLGSSCVYPRMAPQPITEDALLSGPLEETNEWYAIAKIAGIKLAQAYRRQHGCDYIAAMPTNLYGPGDNFDLFSSHVLPALIRKAHEAKRRGDATMTIWGTGRPLRELLHVDDCASAIVELLRSYSGVSQVNVGYGDEISIHDLARLVARVIGFEGQIVFDTSKPDGTPRKLMDSATMRSLGWRPKISLEEGITLTYAWFLQSESAAA